MKGGAAVHRDRVTRVVREDEDGMVVRRVRAPPPFPGVVHPRAPLRTEHVAAHQRGADALEALGGEVLVDARLSFVSEALHLTEGPGRNDPLVEPESALAQGVVDVLIRPGAVSVEGQRERVNSKLGHPESFPEIRASRVS